MNRKCLIRQAVRYAIAAAAASTVPPAFAQTPAAPDQQMEEVTVVGSRIVRQDYEATSPVVTLSQDTFRLSGEAQIETVLAAGLAPTHLDWHCLRDGGRPDVFDLTRGLAEALA